MDSPLDLLSCSHSRWRVKSTSELVWCRQWSKHCSRLLCCRGNLTLRQSLKCQLTFQPHEVNSCSFDYQKDIQMDSRHQQLKRTSRDGSGISSGHHLDAFLVMYSGSVELGWNIDPEHTEEIAHSTWLGGNALPAATTPRFPVRVRWWMDGWNCNNVCMCRYAFALFFRKYRETQTPPLKENCVLIGNGHYCLYSGPIHHLEVCLCVCVSLCVCLAETDKDCPSTLFSWHLSIKGGKGLAEIGSGFSICHTHKVADYWHFAFVLHKTEILAILSLYGSLASEENWRLFIFCFFFPTSDFFHTTKPLAFLLSRLNIYTAKKANIACNLHVT